ncbi:polyprenol phosphomannose-dependent alpha 1,6 mannosyltransferase MptB [Nocardioides maradonensis]
MIRRGLTGSVLVLLGGLVVSTLPRSAPVAHVTTLAALRQSEAGRMVGLSVVLVGLGVLAGAWLDLCRETAALVASRWDEGVDLVRSAAVVWTLPLLVAPPLFSRDGWSYAAQGALAHAGLSPYSYGPHALVAQGPGLPTSLAPILQAVDPMWMHTVTPYGPLPLLLGRMMASVTGNPWVLVVGHRLVALAGLALLAWSVPRLARWVGVNPALAVALVVVSPLMIANGVGGLHNDLLMVGLMAAALVVAVERGWVAGALVATLAASVKVPGGLVCLGVALVTLPVAAGPWHRVRHLAAVGGTTLAGVLVLGVVTGLGNGWVGALAVPGELNTVLSLPTMLGQALDLAARGAGLDTSPDLFRSAVRLLATLALAGVLVRTTLTARTGDRRAAVAATATAVGAFVLLSPVVHLWYLLVVPTFLAPIALARTSRRATDVLMAGSVIAGLTAPLDSSLHGAYLAIVLGVAVLAAVLLALWARQVLLGRAAPSGRHPQPVS